MALIPAKGPIPVGANDIPKSEALEHQKKLITEWKPASDVWPFRYGYTALGVAGSITGLYINHIFRQKLRVRHFGQYFTNICLAAGPAISAIALHDHKVTNKILLYNNNCPLCLETNAVLMQVSSTLLYPLLLAPVANLGIAASAGLRIPFIYEVKEIAKFWWHVVQPKIRTLTFLSAGNALLATTLTQQELVSMEFVEDVLLKMEAEYVEKQNDKHNYFV